MPWSTSQSFISSQQRCVKKLGKCHIARIISGEVFPEFPHTIGDQ